jgi:hypothetical protein
MTLRETSSTGSALIPSPRRSRCTGMALAAATLVSTGVAQAGPPSPGDAPPPGRIPAPPAAPRPMHRNEAMMISGLLITSLAIASVPIGLGLFLGNPTPPPPSPGFGNGGGLGWGCFLCFTDGQIAGMLALGLGGVVLPAIGIPLWVNGAKPAKPATKGAPASWSFAPLTLPPLPGSSLHVAAAPAGVAVVGAF